MAEKRKEQPAEFVPDRSGYGQPLEIPDYSATAKKAPDRRAVTVEEPVEDTETKAVESADTENKAVNGPRASRR